MPSIEERVKNIIVNQLCVKEADVKPESSLKEDLGADSLDAVELVMEMEEAFSIEILDEEADKLVTVADVVKFVEGKDEETK